MTKSNWFCFRLRVNVGFGGLGCSLEKNSKISTLFNVFQFCFAMRNPTNFMKITILNPAN